MTTLYIVDNKARLRSWEITAQDYGYRIQHGVQDGQQQAKQIFVEPKANRTFEQQVELEMQSKINKQLDKGYSYTVEEAQKGTTNAIGLLKPMLAVDYGNVTAVREADCFAQLKYDGNRCLITKLNGEVVAYSRNGKKIASIDHILQDVDIEEGQTLDGELYCHGQTLQTIRSWVSRKQQSSKLLRYINYDIILPVGFEQRLAVLRSKQHGDSITIAPTWKVAEQSMSLKDALVVARADGYEGLILRVPGVVYEHGKRSKSLLKVKAWLEDEFVVDAITQGKDGWAILQCKTHAGKPFSVTSPGSIAQRHHVWNKRDKYIGKTITVKYAALTPDGIPFHPVSLGWRSKGEE